MTKALLITVVVLLFAASVAFNLLLFGLCAWLLAGRPLAGLSSTFTQTAYHQHDAPGDVNVLVDEGASSEDEDLSGG